MNEILAEHKIAAAKTETLLSPLNSVWRQFYDTESEVDGEIFGVRDVYHTALLAHHLLTLSNKGGMSSGASRALNKLRKKIGWS